MQSGLKFAVTRERETLEAYRTLEVDGEKAAEQSRILAISPSHSGTMVQENGEIWTTEIPLHPDSAKEETG